MDTSTLFHAGERRVQELTGERALALLNARNIASTIPAPARQFVGQQFWAVLGAENPQGELWASVLAGPKGFLTPDADLAGLSIALDDPAGALPGIQPFPGLAAGQSLGMLLIELQTRRRLRINGSLSEVTPQRLHLAVEQAFPACPKYIQRRQVAEPTATSAAAVVSHAVGLGLDAALRPLIEGADTLFIATAGPDGRMDLSHRGGASGFAQVRDGAIWIPDYSGNSMFNTLGNLTQSPRSGLSIPDFAHATQLQLSGEARVHLGRDDEAERTGGTLRWIEFRPQRWAISPWNQPLVWNFVDASPFNP